MRKVTPRRRIPAIVAAILLAATLPALQSQTPPPPAPTLAPLQPFPLSSLQPVISRPVQPPQPFTVAGPHGVLVGQQDGAFESWILPVKLLSHLSIEANLDGYSVPIPVNPQASQIEVRPDRTTITYAHIGFTLRQIMFSPAAGQSGNPADPATGPIVLFQIDSNHPLELVFRFTPEMRWMWPKRNDGIPSPDWVAEPSVLNTPPPASSMEKPAATAGGFYVLHMDYPDLAGAVTIPTATPGILAPYQERPQVHPLELHLRYDPKRDGSGPTARYFPLLMAVGTTRASASNIALGRALANLNDQIPAAYKAHTGYYEKLLAETTSITTPDTALNEAFKWGVVSIEQLKTAVPTFSGESPAPPSSATPAASAPDPAPANATGESALVAGYFASADSARPGFGWFFGRDALYTLYAVNSFGDFSLTRAELDFLIARQRADGKIMHEYSQTAPDPAVHWRDFPYMYAAADATPLFLMAMRDYYSASGDLAFLQKNRAAIERAWAFETDPAHDTDHDGIYDNSQGTGWVESWPHDRMPHQEVYLALLDQQASRAYAALEVALGNPKQYVAAVKRSYDITGTIEAEYYDPSRSCYAFSHNPEVNGQPDPNGNPDKTATVYPAIAWWDLNPDLGVVSDTSVDAATAKVTSPSRSTSPTDHVSTPEGTPPLAHPESCLTQFASPALDTDWGARDVAANEPIYDGMSYHQGSVWPLFTGWAALAEYRGNQPLAGQQLLMQNVDLTWAQDPGAVTELLSGDFYVPMGRSTSHQLWSSAMVVTPTLRGLFGINLNASPDAAAPNTITVNPHLPANWDHAEIHGIHVGDQTVDLVFTREKGVLTVGASATNASGKAKPVQLRSDLAGAHISKASLKDLPLLEIPLPALQLFLPDHQLPAPGERPGQLKILSTHYEKGKLTTVVSGPAGSTAKLEVQKNLSLPNLKLSNEFAAKFPGAKASIHSATTLDGPLQKGDGPIAIELTFPKGTGYQTLEFTLTW